MYVYGLLHCSWKPATTIHASQSPVTITADVFITPHITQVSSVTARSHITVTCVSTAVLCVCNLLMCAENMVSALSEIIKSSVTVINTGSVPGRSITINVTYSKSKFKRPKEEQDAKQYHQRRYYVFIIPCDCFFKNGLHMVQTYQG